MIRQSNKLSLRPLKFSAAVTDILKVKPESKPPKADTVQPKPKAVPKARKRR